MTTYFCMRHGLTEWNRQCRIQGNTDVPLCDEGREMARKWGEALAGEGLDCILTGTLSRARETADIINEALGLPVFEDERLGEQNWGRWTGLTKEELKEMRKEVRRQEYQGFGFRPDGGESRDEVLFRACDALIDFSETHSGESVLVITHNGVLKCLAHALSGSDFMPDDAVEYLPYRLHRIECVENELALGELNMEL